MTNSKFTIGGGQNYYKNPLKKLYLKSIIVLLKSFKRYDFGLWFIKLPFYKIFSLNRVKKLQQKRAQRYIALQSAKSDFMMLLKIAPQIKAWVKSSEFKEDYIATNHPCPPLLKPDLISYDSIGAELAWELNLPLPQNYNLIFLSNGGSGVAATLSFLKECGVEYADNMNYTPKQQYLELYKFLINKKFISDSKNSFIVLSFFAECIIPYPKFYDDFKQQIGKNHNDAIKFLNCITKKVPLLYVARDPIGRMRTIINHINSYRITPIMKRFNLNCSYENLFIKPLYFGKVESPSFIGLEDYNEVAFLYTRLLTDSLFKALSNKVTEFYCIEFNDLLPEVAYKTFCKLSDKFGFNKPTNKEAFISRRSFCNGGAITTLPIQLYAHSDDLKLINKNIDSPNLDSLNKKGGFNITIAVLTSEVPRDFVDISTEFESNLIIDEAKIVMLINKKELDLLKQNEVLYDATKSYLNGYIKAAKTNVATTRGNLIKDSDIIEYLRTHSDKRAFYKSIFDNELNYIKTHYPHFLKKWSAYNAFEKMCYEMRNEVDS